MSEIKMLTAFIAAAAAILGILIGGGVRAWEASQSRKHQAKALLFALVAEVESLTRLMDHRQFLPGMIERAIDAEDMISAGNGADAFPFLSITIKHSYFAVFEAATPNIGLLEPYFADRIVRFYMFVKAVQENYDPGSPFQAGVDANSALEVLRNDIQLLQTALILGRHIAQFRTIVPPRGVSDPFSSDPTLEHAQRTANRAIVTGREA